MIADDFAADDRLDGPRAGSQQRPVGDRARGAAVSAYSVECGGMMFYPLIIEGVQSWMVHHCFP